MKIRYRASNNRDGRSEIFEQGDKLGVTYSDMDSTREQSASANSHTIIGAAGGGVATDQTPHHVVYRRVNY